MAAKSEENNLEVFPQSDVEIVQDLGLPPEYKGSNMFMPTGERLYWQAEIVPSTFGLKTCQDFKEIRTRCLAEGALFEDPEFPTPDNLSHENHSKPVKWLRPGDLVENPQLFLGGISRFDINQGALGDCWVLSALAVLAMHKEIFDRVIPDDQSFDKDYAGVFHFRFWQYGRWVDVVIDDLLPTSEGKLLYSHSSQENEFWSALVEKAYAKLYGSYDALKGGKPQDALVDFCGGLDEKYDISDLPADFFYKMMKAYERNSLITTGIHSMELCGIERNLTPRHAYSITCVKNLDSDTHLLRIRNPYGDKEWSGAWSDESPEWDVIPQETKQALGLTVNNDGEFWISFKDFTKYFSYVGICAMNPEYVYLEDPDYCNKKWEMSMFEGKWVKDEDSSDWDPESCASNPQFNITVGNPAAENHENDCNVIISLMHKFRRIRSTYNYTGIWMKVYKVDNSDHLDAGFFEVHQPIYKSKHIFKREVTAKLKLSPGKYVIMPFSYHYDEDGEFFLRVLSEKQLVETTSTPPQVVLI